MRRKNRRTTALAASLTLGLGAAFGFAACGDDGDEDATTLEQTAPEQDITDVTTEGEGSTSEETTTEDSGGVSPESDDSGSDDSSGSGSGGLGY